ncbi:acetyltransferase [Xylariomycetidae sp. FL0641]|nr:acetyltransferase [Xylariomycetidae sp. FL0641]
MATSPPPTTSIPSTAILATEKCYLRPYEASDAEALVRNFNDEQVVRYLRDRFPHPYTLPLASEWISLCLSAKPMTHFVICALPSHEVAGTIGLNTVEATPDVYRRVRELGYVLGKDYWGKGIMGDAARAFVRWAFENLDWLVRISSNCFEGNMGSEKVLLKAGFKKEGVSRQAVFKHGKVLDQVEFGLIRSDLEE